MIGRRSFLAAGAGAAALAAARPARAAAPITTQLQWIKDVQNAGFWVADARGYFRAEGVDATVLAGGPNLASVAAVVAAGRADVGLDLLERVTDANAAGADLVIFGAIYQRNPAALLSLPAHPVRTARDLVGKRLGLQQGAKLYIDAIMRLNHLPAEYTEIVVGFDPEPLVSGACDAYLCFVTNQPLVLAARNIPYETVLFDRLGYTTYVDTLFCTREFLTKNRAALVRYVRALQHGWETNAADPAYAAHLTTATYGSALGLDERQQTAINRAQIPLMESADTRAHGRLYVDPKRVAGPIYTTLRATGRSNLTPVARLIDPTIVAEATRRP